MSIRLDTQQKNAIWVSNFSSTGRVLTCKDGVVAVAGLRAGTVSLSDLCCRSIHYSFPRLMPIDSLFPVTGDLVSSSTASSSLRTKAIGLRSNPVLKEGGLYIHSGNGRVPILAIDCPKAPGRPYAGWPPYLAYQRLAVPWSVNRALHLARTSFVSSTTIGPVINSSPLTSTGIISRSNPLSSSTLHYNSQAPRVSLASPYSWEVNTTVAATASGALWGGVKAAYSCGLLESFVGPNHYFDIFASRPDLAAWANQTSASKFIKPLYVARGAVLGGTGAGVAWASLGVPVIQALYASSNK